MAVPTIPTISDTRAVDHPAGHVAAERVDAERMAGARAQRTAECIRGVGILNVGTGQPEQLDDLRREDRHQDQQDDEDRRRHRDAVRAKAPPEQLPRRAGRDLAGNDLG